MVKDLRSFLKIKRLSSDYRPVCERVKDYKQAFVLRPEDKSKEQGSRCMDCGTPFCHWGCPVGNIIPEWNMFMSQDQWKKAFELLNATNNLPEITGRVCPAPCEFSCVLGINDDPVTIRENELAIIEHAFNAKIIKAHPPKIRTGKKVAVVGSGPSGLSAAAQLNLAGHQVTVFEKDDKLGGVMRYGIPDFKLEKWILDRRIQLWKEEGIEYRTGINVGVGYPVSQLLKEFDAVCLAGGSRQPRDLNIPGRDLKGIHFALDYLIRSNKTKLPEAQRKKVVVIGGGDTGSDCVGTANRQGAACVVQIEIMPMPLEKRPEAQPWPNYPLILKTSSSHEEGVQRKWSILTKAFKGQGPSPSTGFGVKVKPLDGARGKGQEEIVKGLSCIQVDEKFQEIPGTEFEIEADLVFLALGFLGPEKEGMLKELGVEFDQRGSVKTNENFQTSVKGVFVAGDMRRGQSLIVWAIAEGRKAAQSIDAYLMGKPSLL